MLGSKEDVGVRVMVYYLVQISYQTKAWATLVRNPQNRLEQSGPQVKALGGNIECSYMAFGDYDAIAIVNLPDNVTAASLSMALSASGVFKKIKTTPLMTWEDGVEAMKKAKKAAYQPPDDDPVYLDRAG